MGTAVINGSTMGNALTQLLTSSDIEPGDAPSYQLCKTIYLYHPLGAKLAEKPIKLAQSQKREISIPNSPETKIKDAFEEEWKALRADKHIFNTHKLARVYGIASVACLVDGVKNEEPVDFEKLYQQKITFNIYDPLNTAGSLVLNQNPLAMDFLHATEIRVNGSTFHRSRTCVVMNEEPIYIAFTSSSFGFVGRSVYQRTLFPLKSFIQSMKTDDMVTRKVGVIVAMIKQAGSIIDNVMSKFVGQKRNVVKEAETDNVISVGDQDKIESLNLQNLDATHDSARDHILENIASGAGMPAKLITEETFAEGFGEGTEDAKEIARYIEDFRADMDPIYAYFTKIVQHRAWNPDFYATIQNLYPEYKNVSYNEAFRRWQNSFVAKWPSLLTEPPSELVKVDDVKLRACIALVQVLLPNLDPENRARVIEWCADNFNSLKLLFESPLDLDYQALADYTPPQGEGLDVPPVPRPFSAADDAGMGEALRAFQAAVTKITERPQRQALARPAA